MSRRELRITNLSDEDVWVSDEIGAPEFRRIRLVPQGRLHIQSGPVEWRWSAESNGRELYSREWPLWRRLLSRVKSRLRREIDIRWVKPG